MSLRGAAAVLLFFAVGHSASSIAQMTDPYEAWGRVLAKHVDDRGRVDFHGVAADQADLDSFLQYVRRVSPRSARASFPDDDARIAYYLNAYNAIAMFNVIDSGFPRELGAARRLAFFSVKRFTVGGERMSLYTLENDVIRPLGDERVHFALNCMSAGCPRLPREPFRAERLSGMLDAMAREFFAERPISRSSPGKSACAFRAFSSSIARTSSGRRRRSSHTSTGIAVSPFLKTTRSSSSTTIGP